MRTERDIDNAIDRAVRDIMSVDPRPDLRRRVLSRLERPERAWFFFPQLAAAAALIVIVVAAALLRNTDGTGPKGTSHVAKREPASIHLPAPAPPTLPLPNPERASAAPATTRGGAQPMFPPQGRVAAASLPVDATSSPQPGAAGAATPRAEPSSSELAPKPIVIEPLMITPIVIPPIRAPR